MANEKSVLPSYNEKNTGQQVVRLIYLLNYILLAAAITSIVLMLEIRKSPTPSGWGFLVVGLTSVISAITACLSAFDESKHFFVHMLLLFLSLAGQGASFLMIFAKADLTIHRLKPVRDDHSVRLLMKADAGLFICMFCIQLAVLILACGAFNCDFVDDYEDLEAKTSRKRKKLARVQEEAMARATSKEHEAAQELNKKMSEKYGKWASEGEFEAKE